MGLIQKLNNLDEKLLPKRFRGKIYGALAGAAIGLVGIGGAIGYNQYRNEYAYREAEHISAPRNLDVTNDTEANKALNEFPIEIPGAVRVDKYATPGAKYCLVHVRQQHLVEGDEKQAYDLSEEAVEEMSKFFNEPKDKFDSKKDISSHLKETALVQNNIYQILRYLHRDNGLKEIYDEGLIPELEELANDFTLDKVMDEIDKDKPNYENLSRERISQLEKDIKNGRTSAYNAIAATIDYPNDEKGLDKYIAKLKSELEKEREELVNTIKKNKKDAEKNKNRHQYDGLKKAAFEFGIKIIPAETFEGNNKGSLALDRLRKGENDKKLWEMIEDDREDTLLKNVVKIQETPLAVSVYGGAHVWGGYKSFGFDYPLASDKSRGFLRDNIYEWNQKHPDKKFSLIEITPEGLDKDK